MGLLETTPSIKSLITRGRTYLDKLMLRLTSPVTEVVLVS